MSSNSSRGHNVTATSTTKTRTAAREQIQQTWQEQRRRRQEQQQQRQQPSNASTSVEQNQSNNQKIEEEHSRDAVVAEPHPEAGRDSLRTAPGLPTIESVTNLAVEVPSAAPVVAQPPLPSAAEAPAGSVCYLIRKTWEQIWRDAHPSWINNKRNDNHPRTDKSDRHLNVERTTADNQNKSNKNLQVSRPKPGRKHPQADYFPSVLSIFERNALVRQVKSLQGEQQHQTSQYKNSTTAGSTPTTLESQVLSVLPSDYDWNQAVQQTAARRSRAFWLLDLATIVRTTVDWKHRYCRTTLTTSTANSKTNAAEVRFLYNLHQSSNADVRLLQVLLQSGIVSLGTTSKWDLQRAREAVEKAGLQQTIKPSSSSLSLSSTVCNPLVLDCTSVTGKPDGYIREWIQQEQPEQVGPLVVDGPEEVRRICNTVRRIRRRRSPRPEKNADGKGSSPEADPAEITFILRFKVNNGAPLEEWKLLVRDTLTAIRQQQVYCRLVGMSFDFSAAGTSEQQLLSFCRSIEALLDFLSVVGSTDDGSDGVCGKQLRIDLTGVPRPPQTVSSLQSSLAPMKLQERVFSETLVSWWDQSLRPRKDVAQITIDVTKQLVEPAGALCTRIIGVRHQQILPRDASPETDGTESDGTNNSYNCLRRHLYIDDGCYGSLYSNKIGDKSSLCPLPLFSREGREAVRSKTTIEEDRNEGRLFRTTIWGPTCDGLDQVCKDIPLPEMQRDEWLVFPNLSTGQSEGLGTAFNGFSPPDTAICVLGYFAS